MADFPWLKLWPQMVRSKAVMGLSDPEFRAYIGILLMASEAEPRGSVSNEDIELLADYIGIKCNALRNTLRNGLRNGDVTALRNAAVTAYNEWTTFQSANAKRQKKYRDRLKICALEDRG